MDFDLKCLSCGPFQTNAYVILSSTSNKAVVIDPAPESTDAIISILEQYKKIVTGVWLTHSHWDHTADCPFLLEYQKAPVLVQQYDAENLEKPGSDGLPCYVDMQPIRPTAFLNDGDTLSVGDSLWTVIHTPGHSMGSVCFYNEASSTLISGDTLFKGTMGNISFPTSSPHLMGTSLFRLSTLPSQTKVYPGHGEMTILAQEKSWMLDAAEGLAEEN